MKAIPITSGIYAITHIASGKLYVGSSVNMRKRVYEHGRLLDLGKHKNAHLQSAWSLYGRDAFAFSVIQVVAISDLYEVEREHIHDRKSFDRAHGYNKASETISPQRGMKRSAETCAKIGAAKRGNKNRLGATVPEEMRRRIAEKLTGKKITDEHRANLSAARKGKKKSPEWCAKMSAVHKGRTISEEHRAKISATLKRRFSGPELPKQIKKIGRPVGIPMTEASKEKLRSINAGKTLSAEHREKIRAAHSTPEARSRTSETVKARRSKMHQTTIS